MTKRTNNAEAAQDAGSMDQVRDLLFGAQLKEMDTRFQRQEERFERKVADVKEALKTRLDSLENFMKSESASLLNRLREEQAERDSALKSEQRDRAEGLRGEQRERSEGLKAEQRERAEAMAQLSKDLAAAVETFERKIAKVSGTLDTAERELRQLMMTENNTLSVKVDEKYQDALNVIARTNQQIRDDMVHRSALSGIFTEAALKLSGQWSEITLAVEPEAPAAEASSTDGS